METTELIYHIIIIIFGAMLFFTKVKDYKHETALVLKIIIRSIALYIIFYAGIQISKYFGII